MNRLISAQETGTGSWTESYQYDAYGNRWLGPGRAGLPSLTAETPVAQSWYIGNNQIAGWLYDPAGNLAQAGSVGRGFAYDAENRQVIADASGIEGSYAYDGDGKRVTKTVGTAVTTYVYDAFGQLSAEYGAASDAGTKYLTADVLGSTRLVTNGDGTVARNYDYLPFGGEIASGTAGRDGTFPADPYPIAATLPDDFKFAGKERDAETGLDYFGARYYSSAQGRFVTSDKILAKKEWLADPQRWNPYAYVRNNPLRYVDPNGEDLAGVY